MQRFQNRGQMRYGSRELMKWVPDFALTIWSICRKFFDRSFVANESYFSSKSQREIDTTKPDIHILVPNFL